MTVPIHSYSMRSAISALCLSALMLMVGCAKSSAKVSGKVTVNGQPLKGGGTLTFEGSQGGASGIINPDDGTYTISNVPVGEVKITLESGWYTSPATVAPRTGPANMQEKEPISRRDGRLPILLKNIPEKYRKAETSGLTYTVKPGDQTFDIPLTK